jgi:hypothetical protein
MFSIDETYYTVIKNYAWSGAELCKVLIGWPLCMRKLSNIQHAIGIVSLEMAILAYLSSYPKEPTTCSIMTADVDTD